MVSDELRESSSNEVSTPTEKLSKNVHSLSLKCIQSNIGAKEKHNHNSFLCEAPSL